MGFRSVKGAALMFVLVLSLACNSLIFLEKQNESTTMKLAPFKIAFALSPSSNSNDEFGDLGPIPEDNFTMLFPGDNGTGPIPEDNFTISLPEENFTAGLEDNSTESVPEDNFTSSLPSDNFTSSLENNSTASGLENNSTGANSAGTYANGTSSENEQAAIQNSEQIISQLQQNVNQLPKNLQSIISDLQAGQYYGPGMGRDSVTKSYEISFTGSAVSKDSSSTSNMAGKIFLQNMITGDSVIKLKVTGGHIDIGGDSYDLAFGKARVTYSSEGVKNSMTVIAHGTENTGIPYSLRILIQTSSSLEGDYGTTPISLTVQSPQSKINGIWSLSGTGQLSLVQ